MNSLHRVLARAVMDWRLVPRWPAVIEPALVVATILRPRPRPSTLHTPPAPEVSVRDELAKRPGRRRDGEVVVELDSVLGQVAERIVERGTLTEALVLNAMSAAAQEASPGASAALVDWNGSEIARLRAYGIVHGVVLNVLGPSAQSSLLDQMLGTDLALDDPVLCNSGPGDPLRHLTVHRSGGAGSA